MLMPVVPRISAESIKRSWNWRRGKVEEGAGAEEGKEGNYEKTILSLPQASSNKTNPFLTGYLRQILLSFLRSSQLGALFFPLSLHGTDYLSCGAWFTLSFIWTLILNSFLSPWPYTPWGRNSLEVSCKALFTVGIRSFVVDMKWKLFKIRTIWFCFQWN